MAQKGTKVGTDAAKTENPSLARYEVCVAGCEMPSGTSGNTDSGSSGSTGSGCLDETCRHVIGKFRRSGKTSLLKVVRQH